MMHPDRKDQRNANWFAWSAQLLLGLFLGGLAGFYLVFAVVRPYVLDLREMTVVVGGFSLIGGAITSYFGDRLWFRPSVFDAPPPAQSPASRISSLVICSIGAGLVLLVSLIQLASPSVTPESTYRPGWARFSFGAAFAIWCAWRSIRDGKIWLSPTDITRDENPFLFWLCVSFQFIAFGTSCRGIRY